jgi:hypothetical protein
MKWQGEEIKPIMSGQLTLPPLSPPHQFTKGRVSTLEGPPKGDYLGRYEPIEHWSATSTVPVKAPPRTGECNLEPQPYNLLNATHCLLKFTNPSLAGDCWLWMSSGPLQYVATPVSLLNQSGHEAPLNSTSSKPKVRNIQLFQKARSCIYNPKGYCLVGELTSDQCTQVQNCTATAIRYTVDRLRCSSPWIFFVFETLAYQCLPAKWKGVCTLAILTP